MSRKEEVATATAWFCLMINQAGMCPISGGMIATGPMRCGLLNETRGQHLEPTMGSLTA